MTADTTMSINGCVSDASIHQHMWLLQCMHVCLCHVINIQQTRYEWLVNCLP